jgi:hypothetical protein
MKLLPSLLKIVAASALVVGSSLSGAEPGSAQTVKRELDPNGQLFTYVDIGDGWQKTAADINTALKDTPWGKKDFVALADALDLSQIRAFGLSATSLKDGYDNRIFVYTPGGRKGLLTIFPGKPAAFEGARFSPSDADFFADVRLDIPAAVSAITQIAGSVSDNREMAALALDMLRKDPTGYGSLLNFRGRVIAVARLHAHAELAKLNLERPATIPVDVFLRAEGGGALVTKLLSDGEAWKREERGGRAYFTSSKEGTDAVIIVEGETVTAGAPRAFVEECLIRKEGLAQNTGFMQALADTAQMGHAVFYATPRLYSEFREFANASLKPGLEAAEFLASGHNTQYLQQLLNSFPLPTKPVISVLVARADGLLVRQRAPQSLKAALPVVALLTPEFLGQILRLSAQAYAAKDAEDRAGEITHQKISSDLDRAGAAATRFFAAHADTDTVKLSALREAMPEEKLPDFQEIVASEIEFSRQSDKIDFELKIGGSLTHVFTLTPTQRAAIEANLQRLAAASTDYLVAGNSSVSPDTLVEKGFMPKIEPVIGEDYNQVTLELGTAKLTVTTPGAQEISVDRDPLAVVQARHRQAERQIAIEHNLAKIDAIAQQFLVANPDESSVSYEQLAQKELVSEIKPVAGENYADDLGSISKNQEKLEISSPRAGTVTWLRPLDPAVQKKLTKQLKEIERNAAQYFANNPTAEVVISGELLPPPAVKEDKPDSSETSAETSENADQKLPDLTALVIRRDYKNIKVTLDNGHEVEVPRSKIKK